MGTETETDNHPPRFEPNNEYAFDCLKMNIVPVCYGPPPIKLLFQCKNV
jgi:hypothetical protein